MIRLIIGEPSLLLSSKIKNYTDEVLEYKDDFNFITYDFENNSLEEIISSLETPSFGYDKKVVLCKNPYFFKDEKMKLPFKNNLEDLEKYLYNENKDCLFLIICPEKYLNKKSKFYSIISKIGKIDDVLLKSKEELSDYAKILIEKANINITNEAFTILVNRCEDVCKLEREVAKLSIYGDKIDEDIIKKMVSRPLEDDVFELSNALLKKDHRKIMQIYSDLKLLKIEPINLIALLGNQFRLLMQVGILKKKRKTDQDIANILNVHPYRIKLANDYLRNYSLNDVENILVELSTLDEEIKNGQKDRYIDFEIFLATR